MLIALCCERPAQDEAPEPVTKRRRNTDERKRQALAQIELGDLLRNRREGDLRKSQQEIAKVVGCTQGYYAELEAGSRSSGDVNLWVKIADALDLAPKRLLRLVWEARGSLPVALPERRDARREALLDLAIEQSSRELGLSESD